MFAIFGQNGLKAARTNEQRSVYTKLSVMLPEEVQPLGILCLININYMYSKLNKDKDEDEEEEPEQSHDGPPRKKKNKVPETSCLTSVLV